MLRVADMTVVLVTSTNDSLYYAIWGIEQRCADAARFLRVRGAARTDADASLRSVADADADTVTEFVNCTYAMNANKAAIFEFLVIVLT